MGSWSSSAPTLPTGASWSAEVNTGNCWDANYKAYAKVAVARGAGNTIYLRVHIYSWLKKSDQGSQSFPVKCEANDSSGDVASGNVACGGNYYDHWEEIGYRYYTGSASPGTTLRVRLLQQHDSTDAVLYAPDLITFAVDYDGNGSDGGATASQSKVYGVDLTLQTNGYARSGWAFTGWNTAADGSGTGYAAGGTYSANAAVTLYAQWVQTNLPVYANVGGTVKQIAKAYANVGGVIKECAVYANVGGVIKEIV